MSAFDASSARFCFADKLYEVKIFVLDRCFYDIWSWIFPIDIVLPHIKIDNLVTVGQEYEPTHEVDHFVRRAPNQLIIKDLGNALFIFIFTGAKDVDAIKDSLIFF